MQGLLATTDFEWYRHLSSLPDVDEVNFWQPSSYRAIHSIQRGEPLLFKLKAPHNVICGFGLFAGGSELEASLAWDAFGEKNGVRSLEELIARVAKYRGSRSNGEDPKIGCQMARPVFSSAATGSQPADWSHNIVSGKTYDLAAPSLASLAQALRPAKAPASGRPASRAPARSRSSLRRSLGTPERAKRVEEALARPRGTPHRPEVFRVHVTQAWGRACAITGEHSSGLEGRTSSRSRRARTTACLTGCFFAPIFTNCSTRYVTVTLDLVFRVSPRLDTDWKTGRVLPAQWHPHRIKTPRTQAGAPILRARVAQCPYLSRRRHKPDTEGHLDRLRSASSAPDRKRWQIGNLELILGPILRKDVKPLCRKLINRFGGIPRSSMHAGGTRDRGKGDAVVKHSPPSARLAQPTSNRAERGTLASPELVADFCRARLPGPK